MSAETTGAVTPPAASLAADEPLPHNIRWDEVSAQILARQEADRRKQPKTKPA